MCNLNLYFKNKVYTDERLNQLIGLISSTTANSFVSNDDGEGFYFDVGTIQKSVNKLNPFKFVEQISNSNFILTHQRWATHGDENYVQPFETDEFVIAHNGVLSTYVELESKHSDTFNMVTKFVEKFSGSSKTERRNKIIDAIKKTFDNVSGSFSVIIYDKVSKISYYFKDDSTKMKAYINKTRDFLYMTTCSDNSILLTLMNEEFYEKEIVKFSIYEISILDKIYAKKVGTIKEKTYNTCMTYYGGSWREQVIKDNEEKIKEIKTQEPTGVNALIPKEETRQNALALGLDGVKEKGECVYCGTKTHWCACDLDMYICPLCMDSEFEEIFNELSVIRSGADGEEYDIIEYNKGFKVKEVTAERGIDEKI